MEPTGLRTKETLARKALDWVDWETFAIALTAAVTVAALAKSFGVFD